MGQGELLPAATQVISSMWVGVLVLQLLQKGQTTSVSPCSELRELCVW